MAARYLRRHGDHRARAGRGPGKIQPLWRRVSLTARTSGGGLGSVAPAVRPWRRGPRARTGTPGRSQTPPNSHSPGVTLQHSPDPAYRAVFLTVNVQPRVCTTQAQARLENDPSLCASLCTPGRPGYTLSHRSVPVPKACATGSNAGYCAHRAASETHLVECGLHVLQTPLFRSPKQHPRGPGTCRSSQYIRSCTRLAHPLHASPRGHVQHRFPRASRRPLPGTRHEHSPRVCSGTRTRALCRGTLARTLTSVLAQGPLAGIPTCSSKHTGQSRGAHSPPGEPPADAICLPIGARICGGKCCIRWRAHLLCAL